jgi:hypothetical protein
MLLRAAYFPAFDFGIRADFFRGPLRAGIVDKIGRAGLRVRSTNA